MFSKLSYNYSSLQGDIVLSETGTVFLMWDTKLIDKGYGLFKLIKDSAVSSISGVLKS